ncbi:MAG: PIN domain nuclease [Patulibacter sp.]
MISSRTASEWLIDKSALVRLGQSARQDDWQGRVQRGLVHVATATLLEVGYSAQNVSGLRRSLDLPPISLMPVAYATPPAEDRAVEVLGLLCERGQHRAPSIPDLMIAAIAELTGLTVLHDDKDFELIGEVTGQPMHRLG